VQEPSIAYGYQSDRAQRLEDSGIQVNAVDDTNARVIDRDALIAQQDPDSNYGRFQ
jgi:hypothetical protein